MNRQVHNFTEEQVEQIAAWDKTQIYEAYLVEYKERKNQTQRANRAERKLKEVEWNIKTTLKSISGT